MKKQETKFDVKIVKFSDGTGRVYVFNGDSRIKEDFTGEPNVKDLAKKLKIPESDISEAWKNAK